jgi:hypothetical protein
MTIVRAIMACAMANSTCGTCPSNHTA